MVHLIADDREHSVTPLIAHTFENTPHIKAAGFTYAVMRIAIGDYIIIGNAPGEIRTVPLCCIERKTMSDFVASMYDNRLDENTKKMIDYRTANPGCRLIYFIENNSAFHADTSTFGHFHTPYKQIKHVMDMLKLRDDIHIVLTKNPEHTKDRLIDFMYIYDRLNRIVYAPLTTSSNAEELLEDMVASSVGLPVDVGSLSISASASGTGGTSGIESMTSSEFKSIVKEVTTAIPRNVATVLVNSFWSRLPGIKIITAESIVAQCSILEFISRPQIYQITSENGKALSPIAKASLAKVVNGERETQIKCLSAVDRVSVNIASNIVDVCKTLPNITPELLATVRVKHGTTTRGLSKDVIEKIMIYLNFKIGS